MALDDPERGFGLRPILSLVTGINHMGDKKICAAYDLVYYVASGTGMTLHEAESHDTGHDLSFRDKFSLARDTVLEQHERLRAVVAVDFESVPNGLRDNVMDDWILAQAAMLGRSTFKIKPAAPEKRFPVYVRHYVR